MIRLVHITTVPQSLVSYLRGQVGYLRERGFDIVGISSPGPHLDAFATEHEIPVIGVEMPRKITPFKDLRALRPLVAALRQLRPHIVHAHTPKGGLLAMLAARVTGVPIRIYHMRGLPMETARGWQKELLKWAERTSCAAATHVLCVSHSLREVAVQEHLCSAEKIEVLAHGSGQGVDATGFFAPDRVSGDDRRRARERFGVGDEDVVIGFVGRLVRDKGIVELVEAWRALRERHANVHLVLLGELEVRDALAAETVQTLDTDPRIHRLDFDWDTPPLYAAMDLVVLPTYREGFPNVPLEAAAMARPVVATRVTGCVDAVVDGETGLLVPARDAAALADAISRYVVDPELRAAHGRQARARVLQLFRRELIWEAVHRKYVEYLRQAGLVGSGDLSE